MKPVKLWCLWVAAIWLISVFARFGVNGAILGVPFGLAMGYYGTVIKNPIVRWSMYSVIAIVMAVVLIGGISYVAYEFYGINASYLYPRTMLGFHAWFAFLGAPVFGAWWRRKNAKTTNTSTP